MSNLLCPKTFTVPVLPSHEEMPEDKQPRFVFKARTWRDTIELDEITAKFRDYPDQDGPIAKLMFEAIQKYLVAAESADPEQLTYFELVQLFASMRECEKLELAIKKNLQLPLESGRGSSVPAVARTAQDPGSSETPATPAGEPAAKTATGRGAGN